MATMNELLSVLKKGEARSLETMALELDTSVDDVSRMLEYMEQRGILKKTDLGKVGHEASSCSAGSAGCSTSCAGCDKSNCAGCMPSEGFSNMGTIWEVV